MVDLHTILADHRSKSKHLDARDHQAPPRTPKASGVEIPDLFFDQILVDYKFTRVEILVLMFLYRQVYCKPNLYRDYGISQLLSHTEMCKTLGVELEDVHHVLRKLENLGFIETIRLGQYFVRKFFTKAYDEQFGQTYQDFDL